mgnify:CR=1 FL=1
MKYINTLAAVSPSLMNQAEKLAEAGKTPLLFAKDGKLLGIIAVADVIKPDSAQAVKELQNMGIHVVMLTGDNKRTARAIGAQAGVDQVIAGVLPDGKESVIRSLKEKGKVAMVGDGINDAPAYQSRYWYCHRCRNGYSHRCSRYCPYEKPAFRRASCYPYEPRYSSQHPRESLLGVLLQCNWYSAAAGVWIPIFGWT